MPHDATENDKKHLVDYSRRNQKAMEYSNNCVKISCPFIHSIKLKPHKGPRSYPPHQGPLKHIGEGSEGISKNYFSNWWKGSSQSGLTDRVGVRR